MAGEKKQATKPDSEPAANALPAAHKRLKAALAQLEREYTRLSAELAARKKKAATRPPVAAAAGLERLRNRLERYGDAALRQQRFLAKLKRVQHQNEALLALIAARLDEIELQVAGGQAPEPNVRRELLTMLQDLEEMRLRRERLSSGISAGAIARP